MRQLTNGIHMKLITGLARSILIVSLLLMLTGNWAFFKQLNEAYPFQQNLAFTISVWVLFFAATVFFFGVVCHGRVGKYVLAVFAICAAIAGHFMDTYGTVIDGAMLGNVLQTNPGEAYDLLNWTFVLRLGVLGLLPAILLIHFTKTSPGLKQNLVSSGLLLMVSVLAMGIAIGLFTNNYASFFREHKTIRFYANPTYFSYSAIKLLAESLRTNTPKILKQIELAGKISIADPHRELVILVVGETARADHFSLNGYPRATNPALEKQGVLSFSNVTSCGTSTAVSVPCMFSDLTRANYDKNKALAQQNVLDILARSGVHVLWRDNNSDSKGVADRVEYQDFRTSATNPVCDIECRDVGLLSGLQVYIDSKKTGDILVVLHQMGNHGPAYYKRYPETFEQFKPVCKTNELANCTQEEIVNAYDNAVLYTDFFLNKTIDFLKQNDAHFETAMLYVSDHGESLGESGIYLHGAPYAFAPLAQIHVPAILWLGKHHDYSLKKLEKHRNKALSHDDLFCVLLIAYEVENTSCDQKQGLASSE